VSFSFNLIDRIVWEVNRSAALAARSTAGFYGGSRDLGRRWWEIRPENTRGGGAVGLGTAKGTRTGGASAAGGAVLYALVAGACGGV